MVAGEKWRLALAARRGERGKNKNVRRLQEVHGAHDGGSISGNVFHARAPLECPRARRVYNRAGLLLLRQLWSRRRRERWEIGRRGARAKAAFAGAAGPSPTATREAALTSDHALYRLCTSSSAISGRQ